MLSNGQLPILSWSFCAILGPHADVALWAEQHHAVKVLTSRNHIGPFLPLDGCEAANPALHTTELIGHLRCHVEREDLARGGQCEQIIVNARFEGRSSGNAVRPVSPFELSLPRS
jgi:hypothetical protein